MGSGVPPGAATTVVDRGVPAPAEVTDRDVRWTSRAEWRVARRRQRSGLGLATMGAALVVVGAMALVDNASSGLHLSLARYLGLALAVIGIGLVVGTWWGRSRGLIVVGALVVPVLLVSSLVNVPIEGGFGDRTFEPVTRASSCRTNMSAAICLSA